jgi:chromosome transmission fidelity protein 8
LIGHHLLEGKIQVLSKPLAILVRSRTPVNSHPESISNRDEDADSGADSVDEDEAMAIDDSDYDSGVPGHSAGKELKEANGSRSGLESSGVSWTIAAVVKKKIIFSKRPTPVSNKNVK